MSFLITENFSDKDWDYLIESSNQESFFCKSQFLKFTNNSKKFIIKQDSKIVAGTIISDIDDLNVIPFFYQGLIISKSFLDKKEHKANKNYIDLLDSIITFLVSKFKKFNFSLHPSIKDIRPFDWYRYNEKTEKFIIKIKYTGILKTEDYLNFEDYLKNIRSVRRQEYKKKVLDYDFIEEKNIDNLDHLHDLTFKKQNKQRSEVEKKILNDLIPKLIEKKIGRLISIKLKSTNKVVASSYFLHFKKNAYNLVLATDPDYRKYFFGTKILLNQIQNCFENKIEKIDFVGLNSPNRGDFKPSFNPNLTSYFEINYSR